MSYDMQEPEIDVFRHFYWAYRNVRGAPHPCTMDGWALSDKEQMDACREVQMGRWTPHNTPCDPEDCDHPPMAEHVPSIAHGSVRLRYVYCGRCGQAVNPYLYERD